jgi:aryl carrier-like protein
LRLAATWRKAEGTSTLDQLMGNVSAIDDWNKQHRGAEKASELLL